MHLHVEGFSQNIYGTLAEDLGPLKGQENLHGTGYDKRKSKKKKREKGIGMAPEARGGSCDRGKPPACWEARLRAGRTVRTEAVLWSPG